MSVLLFLISLCFANNEVVSANPSTQNLSSESVKINTVELLNCTPADSDQEAKSKAAAQATRLSATDILARLIFSEGLSTGYWNQLCSEPSDTAFLEGIGWGVLNRTKGAKTAEALYSVIFQKNQFRTSFSPSKPKALSGFTTNPFAVAFLCPQKAQNYLKASKKGGSAEDLFKTSYKIAESIIATDAIPAEYRGIANFFYPQSEQYGALRPNWAKPNAANRMKLTESETPCVEYYKSR